MSDLHEDSNSDTEQLIPFDMNRDVLSKLYVLRTTGVGSKFLLKIFPSRDPFKHSATSMSTEKAEASNGGSIAYQAKKNLKDMVQSAIENELGAMKWCQTRCEGLLVPEILGFSHHGCETHVGECLNMFGLMGFILMKYPQGGVLYEGPAHECRLEDSSYSSLSKCLAGILYELRKERQECVSGFGITTQDVPRKDYEWQSSGTRSRFDLIVNALDRNSKDKAKQISQWPQKPVVLPGLSARAISKQPQRNGQTAHDFACNLNENHLTPYQPTSSPTLSDQSSGIGSTWSGLLELGGYFDGIHTRLSPSSEYPSQIWKLPPAERPLPMRKPSSKQQPIGPRESASIPMPLPRLRTAVNMIPPNVERQRPSSNVTERIHDTKEFVIPSRFDQDPSLYCSHNARKDMFHGNVRGDIARLEYDPSSSSSSPRSASARFSTSTATPLSPLNLLKKRISGDKGESIESRPCMTENFLCWPTRFIHPTSATKHDAPASIAEYEQSQLINALVALERLDSHPGSTCRFPRQLLDQLPRILCIAHDELLFSGSNLDLVPRRRIIAKDPARRLNLQIPSIFAGTTSVFTHSHLDPSSFIINRQNGGILALINFQHAGFLPSYTENVQAPFIETNHYSFWNVNNTSEISSGDNSEGNVKNGRRSWENRSKLISFISSSSTSSALHNNQAMHVQSVEKLPSALKHNSFGLVLSPQPCLQQQQGEQQQQQQQQQQHQHQRETNQELLSLSHWKGCRHNTSYPVVNYYPTRGSDAGYESIEYSEHSPYNPVINTTVDASIKSHVQLSPIQSQPSTTFPYFAVSSNQLHNAAGGFLTPKSPKVNKVGWTEFMDYFRDLEHKDNKENRTSKTNTSRVYGQGNLSSSPSTSMNKTKDLNGHDSKVLEALVSISKTLQNLVVVLEAGGIVLTPDQLSDAIASKKDEWKQKQERLRQESLQSMEDSLVESTSSLDKLLPPIPQAAASRPKVLKTVLQKLIRKKNKKESLPMLPMYRPRRTSADNILYSAPGVQRDPLPSELPDHLLLPPRVSSDSVLNNSIRLRLRPNTHEEIIVPIASDPILGSIAAPHMPAYGIQLSNLERTKALAHIEMEKIEAQERLAWKEFEGFRESLQDKNNNEGGNSGIALLQLEELESRLETVENFVLVLEGQVAKYYRSKEKKYKNHD
ncbi:hypothetical protein BGZ46_004042 [Entomortierella lignicola]|nr:hypothetical protein BGZ46_004042 [Entomortierella lignicola]